MATAPNLPLFFNDLVPLSTSQHANLKLQSQDSAPFLIQAHAVPVTIDEFIVAGRFFPIVFSAGSPSVPIALMGMNEGINLFVDKEGKLTKQVYVPAYVRRYPFLLAKLRDDSDELSLCFDPTAPGLSEDGDGAPLFDGDQPSKATSDILEFCKNFEEAGARTQAFMAELEKLDLLMDGEMSIQAEGQEQPYVYRGFRMIDENKLRDLRGDALRRINQNGILPLIYAHLFSMGIMRDLFAEQLNYGLVPPPNLQPIPAA